VRSRIVIVDDDVFRTMLAAVLEDASHDVVGELADDLAGVRLRISPTRRCPS
jgi:hypothetical protein